jgi:hypothetical protein
MYGAETVKGYPCRPHIDASGRRIAVVSRETLWITDALLAVLLELAADAEPRPANVLLLASAPADLEPLPNDGLALESVPADVRVLSDFYFPEVGNAVKNVFGVDLATPAGQSHGRFLSHPMGDPSLSVTDDLHANVLVAVPPWTPENVSAYDRWGTRLVLKRVAASSPDVEFSG